MERKLGGVTEKGWSGREFEEKDKKKSIMGGGGCDEKKIK
jgi:hypothetical protein